MSNLSYPPLEDAVLAGLSLFFGGNVERAYPLYLGLLIAAELAAIVYFSRVFKSVAAQVFFLLTMLFLLHVDKPGLTFFQGLSFVDLLITGLSAEVLSFVFLLLLLRDLIAGVRSPRIAFLIALTLLSHLVVGPVAFLTVLVFAAVERRLDLVRHAGVALLLAAFFLLPFLEARGQFFTSTIFRPHPYFMATLLVFAAVFLFDNRRFLPVALTALVITLPTEVNEVFEEWFGRQLFPAYHYYRLAILALVYLAVATAALLEDGRRTSSRRLDLAIKTAVVLFLVFLLRDFHLHAYDLQSAAYRKPQLSESLTLPKGDAFDRVFVIHPERACDFYLDSLFVTRGSPARFNKGLYWESSRNHVLLSSYLGTLLSTEALVLDYSYYESPTCPELQCFLDHFARDFNLGWILIPSEESPAYLSAARRRCYAKTWMTGTPNFSFTLAERLTIDRRSYALYRLEPRGELDPAVVEVVAPEDLRRLDPERPAFFAPVLEDTMAACKAQTVNRAVYVYDGDFQELQAHLETLALPPLAPDEMPPPVDFRRLGRGEYGIRVDASSPVVFRVKLNYYPGFELVQAEDGRRLPLYDGAGSQIGVGHGEMVLRYRRTGWMLLGYALSTLTLAALAIASAVRTWRRRRAAG